MPPRFPSYSTSSLDNGEGRQHLQGCAEGCGGEADGGGDGSARGRRSGSGGGSPRGGAGPADPRKRTNDVGVGVVDEERDDGGGDDELLSFLSSAWQEPWSPHSPPPIVTSCLEAATIDVAAHARPRRRMRPWSPVTGVGAERGGAERR